MDAARDEKIKKKNESGEETNIIYIELYRNQPGVMMMRVYIYVYAQQLLHVVVYFIYIIIHHEQNTPSVYNTYYICSLVCIVVELDDVYYIYRVLCA